MGKTGRETCSWNVIYEKRIKIVNELIFLQGKKPLFSDWSGNRPQEAEVLVTKPDKPEFESPDPHERRRELTTNSCLRRTAHLTCCGAHTRDHTIHIHANT